jgi:hypothetical protein
MERSESRNASSYRLITALLRGAALLMPVIAGAADSFPDLTGELSTVPPPRRADHVYRLEELCESALEHSPRIHEQVYRVQARKSNVVLRRHDLMPELNLNANYTNATDTDLLRSGARINWWSDWSELRLRDLEIARLGLIKSYEYVRRERVWVLNDVATKYRNLAVMQMRVDTYERVIDLTRRLTSAEPGFELERDLKIDEYTTELVRIRDRIVDVSSQLSSLAFGDPYAADLRIDSSSVRYVEIPIDRKAVVRRAVKERLRPEVYNFEQGLIRVKLATRRYQPSVSASIERWRVQGTAGQGFTDSDTTIRAGLNFVVNPWASRAAHRRAVAELNVARAETLVDLNNLINSTERALDRFFQNRDNLLTHYEKYGGDPVGFREHLVEIYGPELERLDRQVFTTLDLLIRNDLNRIEFLSDYLAALITLNNHVMVTPLEQYRYRDLDPDNTMPEIFEYLTMHEETYQRHRERLISP